MNSVFEKITLYDFFGYLIPGITFETIICISTYFKALSGTSGGADFIAFSTMAGYLYVFYFLLGYVIGIIFSEISRWIFTNVDKKLKKSYYERVADELSIQGNTIWKSLILSGLVDKNDPEPACCAKILNDYIQVMQGNIQADDKYKRIHDYSSYATMCKNLSAAILVGGLLSCWMLFPVCGFANTVIIAVTSLLVTIVFGFRYERFNVKKGIYTVTWFVTKNVAGQKNSANKGENTK